MFSELSGNQCKSCRIAENTLIFRILPWISAISISANSVKLSPRKCPIEITDFLWNSCSFTAKIPSEKIAENNLQNLIDTKTPKHYKYSVWRSAQNVSISELSKNAERQGWSWSQPHQRNGAPHGCRAWAAWSAVSCTCGTHACNKGCTNFVVEHLVQPCLHTWMWRWCASRDEEIWSVIQNKLDKFKFRFWNVQEPQTLRGSFSAVPRSII